MPFITSKGFLRRKKTLNVHGAVKSAAEKDRVMKIVERQAGETTR
jgi:hypothetical protein